METIIDALDRYLTTNTSSESFNRLRRKNKLEDVLQSLALHEHVRLSSPTLVGLDVTSRCNMRCAHCFLGDRHIEDELNTNDITELIDQLKDMDVYQIYIMGGEPFLRKDMMQIIEHVKGSRMTISINTNATLIEDASELSKMLNPMTDWIQISLDGACAETHDKLRGNGSFQLVCKKIEMLTKSGVVVRINTVVTENNIEELESIYKICHELGVSKLSFNPLYPYKRVSGVKSPSNEQYINEFTKVVLLHYEMDEPLSLEQDPFTIPYSFDRFDRLFNETGTKGIPRFSCRAGLYSCEIDPMGNVYPCTFMHDEAFCAGNIKQNRFKEIWLDESKWTTIFDKDYKKNPYCVKCKYGELCKGGCIAAGYDCFNNKDYPDPRCLKVEDYKGVNS